MNHRPVSRSRPRTPSTCLVCSGLAALLWVSVAHADIYRWTNDKGEVVYSNVAPASDQASRNLALVTRSSPVPAQPAPGPAQHELLARIQMLEQQLQLQSAPPVVVAAPLPAAPAVTYVQPAPAPALAYYDNGWAEQYERTSLSPLFPSLLPTTIVTITPLHWRHPFARRGAGRDGFHAGFGSRGHGPPGRGPGGGMHRGR